MWVYVFYGINKQDDCLQKNTAFGVFDEDDGGQCTVYNYSVYDEL